MNIDELFNEILLEATENTEEGKKGIARLLSSVSSKISGLSASITNFRKKGNERAAKKLEEQQKKLSADKNQILNDMKDSSKSGGLFNRAKALDNSVNNATNNARNGNTATPTDNQNQNGAQNNNNNQTTDQTNNQNQNNNQMQSARDKERQQKAEKEENATYIRSAYNEYVLAMRNEKEARKAKFAAASKLDDAKKNNASSETISACEAECKKAEEALKKAEEKMDDCYTTFSKSYSRDRNVYTFYARKIENMAKNGGSTNESAMDFESYLEMCIETMEKNDFLIESICERFENDIISYESAIELIDVICERNNM